MRDFASSSITDIVFFSPGFAGSSRTARTDGIVDAYAESQVNSVVNVLLLLIQNEPRTFGPYNNNAKSFPSSALRKRVRTRQSKGILHIIVVATEGDH